MSVYNAPTKDMLFVLKHIVKLDEINKLPGYEHATEDIIEPTLDAAAKLAAEVLAPINAAADKQHCQWKDGVVTTPDGYKEAYAQYRDDGWNSVPFTPEYEGQGLPWAVAFAVQEMWHSSNLAFGLCPMLNQGAVELLEAHGDKELKDTYLPKMISGEWTGTMNLTEPSAGSDLGALSSKAVRDEALGERVYRITGQKIFITFGEHDLAENIIHMVLARVPDAPAGAKGISLFVVPKFLKDGSRNDLICSSIEHKLGINGSPTCTMSFGDNEGAIGYLVGEENRGLMYMFTMMNNARMSVGLEGVAIAERSYQQAVEYAKERVQSASVSNPRGGPVRIVEHPDIRRMLLTMRAYTEASRSLAYYAVSNFDRAKHGTDPEAKKRASGLVELLTPIVKSWGTDRAVDSTSLGIQVHGGMGYVEETGAAQHWRDSRITPIYEGTNGIQANDFVFRKTARDGGAGMKAYLQDVDATLAALEAAGDDRLSSIRTQLLSAKATAEKALTWLLAQAEQKEVTQVAASAAPYLDLMGLLVGAELLARGAVAALAELNGGASDKGFYKAKIEVAQFFAEHLLPRVHGLLGPVCAGASTAMSFDEEQL